MRRSLVPILVGWLLAGCGSPQQVASARRGPQDITMLFELVNGSCVKSLPLPAIPSTRGSHITWHIVNLCGRPIDVAIRFTGDDPTVPPVKERRNVPPRDPDTHNPANAKIEATVKGNPPNPDHGDERISYAYSVYLDGTLLTDPEIIIDWTVPLQ